MSNRAVPFVDPSIDESEVEAVSEVVRSKNLVEGKRVRSFESKFRQMVGTKYAIACTNGTVALHLAMESSPLLPGDEVITTPFTFIATTNSILFIGAVPKFADVDTHTWNLDPERVEDQITDKTKGIMPVHIFGLPANMKAFQDLAEDRDLYLIEDAAQAHGAGIDGQHVGGFGDVATFSLYATKNLISGEGGIITTDNDEIAEKLYGLKNHGRPTSSNYIHTMVGYNGRMSELAGAIADVQMNKLIGLLKRRSEIASQYRKLISEIENLDFQHIPDGHTPGNYIFAVDTRNHDIKPYEATALLKEKGVLSRPIYSTLSYQQTSFKDLSSWRWSKFVDYPNYSTVKCPISEEIAANHFEIPVVPSLITEEIEKVKTAILEVFTT